MLNKAALVLAIIGALNWGSIGLFKLDLVASIGLFKLDLVASIFGGQLSTVSRIIFTLVGFAGLWCITLLFDDGHRA